MKSSISEIPVTISAFSMGILVIPIIMVRVRFFIVFMAIQAMVPITVAMMEESSAISKVFPSARRISSLCTNCTYHLKVKPPHLARVLLALKDRTINVAIGA